MARSALEGGAHLPVEKEVDDGPVTEQAVGPLLEAELIQLSILALRVLDVRLLHAQIQLLMEPINAESEELLSILLIEAAELLTDTSHCRFKMPWHDRLTLVPDSVHH